MPDKDKFEISEGMLATVSTWRGKKRVDIRKWYQKDGEFAPGKNGLNMTAEEWSDFCAKFEEIKSFVDTQL
jgi:hypothetical protein